MIVVVASRHDSGAASLAARWASQGAALLTPADLSIGGWRFHAGAPHASVSVVNGHLVANQEITGVLTRLAGVAAYELDHIATEDRAYVAAEMNAFLVAWLSALRCPMLNRPSPNCLCGPEWRRERWVRLAAQLGISIVAVHRDSTMDSEDHLGEAGATVTVVGDRTFGSVDSDLARDALRLAEAAGVGLLEVRFTGGTHGSGFLGVDLRPDLSNPELADAVLEYFGETSC